MMGIARITLPIILVSVNQDLLERIVQRMLMTVRVICVKIEENARMALTVIHVSVPLSILEAF